MPPVREIILKPRSGWQPIDIQELWRRRELFQFLVLRDIKIRYKQTVLGGLWAVLQPASAMVVFALFFNRLAGINSDGPPYPLFVYAGLLLWIFFANALAMSSNSLVGNQVLVSKVYFPRIFIPLASIAALLLDLVVGAILMALLMMFYGWPIAASVVQLPLYVIGTALGAGGLGLILSALNVRFRDVKYIVPFFIQMGLFVTPVIYPLSYVPAQYQLLLALNPMVGMVEGFRSALLGGAVDWRIIAISCLSAAVMFLCGVLVFGRMERQFADII